MDVEYSITNGLHLGDRPSQRALRWEYHTTKLDDGFTYLKDFYVDQLEMRKIRPLTAYYAPLDPVLTQKPEEALNWVARALCEPATSPTLEEMRSKLHSALSREL